MYLELEDPLFKATAPFVVNPELDKVLTQLAGFILKSQTLKNHISGLLCLYHGGRRN